MNSILKQLRRVDRPKGAQLMSTMTDSDVARSLKALTIDMLPTGRESNSKITSKMCYNVLGKLQTFQDNGAQVGVKSVCCAMWINVKYGLPNVVPRLFDHMKIRNIEPGIQGYNILATAFASMGDIQSMWKVIGDMEKAGFHPNIYTFNNCMGACNRGGNPDQAFKLLEEMLQRKINPDAHTWSRLILSGENVHQAYRIIDIMKRMAKPSFIHYNAVLSVCLKELDCISAEECLNTMRSLPNKDGRPNTCSYTTLMTIFSRLGRFDDVVRIYHLMRDHAISPNTATYIVFIGSCNSTAMKSHDKDRYIQIANIAFKQAIDEGIDDSPVIMTYAKMLEQHKRLEMFSEAREYLLDNDIDVPVAFDRCSASLNKELQNIKQQQAAMGEDISPQLTTN